MTKKLQEVFDLPDDPMVMPSPDEPVQTQAVILSKNA